MAQPQDKMNLVIYAEVTGHQTIGRLTEAIYKALGETESIQPVTDGVVVRELLRSRIRYNYHRQMRRLRCRINARSKEERYRRTLDVMRIIVPPAITFFLGVWLGK